MNADLEPRGRGGALSTARHDPRDDWKIEAQELRHHLEGIYGTDDPLPTLAGGWITRQKSHHTRRGYARAFKRWEEYARSTGVHPLHAKFMLADSYANHLESAPTQRRVKGGKAGESAPTGPPMSDTSRAQALSACGSFYTYAIRAKAADADPFSGVNRPYIDPDYSPTKGMLPEETVKLIETARDWSPRSYALVTVLYLLGPRIDELLRLDAHQIEYDRGHYVLPLRTKGNKKQFGTLTPLALDALRTYLNGRDAGPMFTTASGERWTEPQVWKHLRVLARRAGIPAATSIKPHTLRHNFITDYLAIEGARIDFVQAAAGHTSSRTTARYNRRRELPENHPGHKLAPLLAAALQPTEEPPRDHTPARPS